MVVSGRAWRGFWLTCDRCCWLLPPLHVGAAGARWRRWQRRPPKSKTKGSHCIRVSLHFTILNVRGARKWLVGLHQTVYASALRCSSMQAMQLHKLHRGARHCLVAAGGSGAGGGCSTCREAGGARHLFFHAAAAAPRVPAGSRPAAALAPPRPGSRGCPGAGAGGGGALLRLPAPRQPGEDALALALAAVARSCAYLRRANPALKAVLQRARAWAPVGAAAAELSGAWVREGIAHRAR